MEVPYFLKLDGERLLFNQDGELAYYVPQTFFDRNYCFIEGQYATLIGIFNYAIFDAKGNHKGLKQFNLPSTFLCKPNRIEKIKKVKLTATTEEDDYTVLYFKKGDEVIVIAGKDKGKTGKVVQVIPSQDKVVVEGVAIVKRHTKPTQKMPQGGIIEKEAAIHVSNVMPFCSTCKKGVRVAHTIENGTKTRVCRKCGKAL